MAKVTNDSLGITVDSKTASTSQKISPQNTPARASKEDAVVSHRKQGLPIKSNPLTEDQALVFAQSLSIRIVFDQSVALSAHDLHPTIKSLLY